MSKTFYLLLLYIPFIFTSCKNDKTALSCVPSSAEGVAVINLQSLGKDILSGQTSFEELSQISKGIRFGEINEFKLFLKSATQFPINFFSKGAIFSYSRNQERVFGISIPLLSDVKSTIERTEKYKLGNLSTGNSYFILDKSSSVKSIVVLDENYLFILQSKLSADELKNEATNLSKLPKIKSYEEKTKGNNDCQLFGNANGITIEGSLNFEKGLIKINLSQTFVDENPLDTLFNKPINYQYDTSSIISIQANVNPHLLNNIPLLPEEIKKAIDSTNVFDGPLSLTLKGVELRSRHFITYEEDDNFNLIEKTSIKVDTVNKVYGFVEGNTDVYDSFLNHFIALNILQKEKNNWFSSPLLLDSYQITAKKNRVYFSSFEHDFNEHSHESKGLAHLFINIEKIHELEKNKHFWEGYSIDINPLEHFYFNQNLKSVNIEVLTNKEINMNIDFKNRNENSLIECVKIIKQLSDLNKKINKNN